MPTLLSVNNYYYHRGGAESVFLSHNTLLKALNWQVIPFSMQHKNNLKTTWSKYFVKEIEFGEKYSLIEKIQRVPKSIYSLEARSNIREIINEYKVDICHVHNIYHHISPSILGLIKSNNIPIVMTLHDLKIACPAYNMVANDGICERCKNGKIYNVLLHKCIKNSASLSAIVLAEAVLHRVLRSYERNIDSFIVPSKFYINKLVEWGWDKNRFIHIPNFLNIEDYKPDYNPGKYYLYFGRLSKEKGIKTLITACVEKCIPLRIVGTGPDENALRMYAEKVDGDVEFLGYQRGTTLHNIIRLARAVVLPSEWYENAPLSVMEAYALGKPVIGANIGGIPELIQEGITGCTFDSGSVSHLAEKLLIFSNYSNKELSDMGKNGRVWMERQFSKNQYIERILKQYAVLGVQAR